MVKSIGMFKNPCSNSLSESNGQMAFKLLKKSVSTGHCANDIQEKVIYKGQGHSGQIRKIFLEYRGNSS